MRAEESALRCVKQEVQRIHAALQIPYSKHSILGCDIVHLDEAEKGPDANSSVNSYERAVLNIGHGSC